MRTALIIPANDEEGSIGRVVRGFSARGVIGEIVVVDNASKDHTGEVARAAGASVVREERRGYGSACLAGIRHLRANPPGAVVFADGDGSNDPADLDALLQPIVERRADLTIGARRRKADPGSLTLPQRFGNVLACGLMNLLFGTRYTDLGPFRAITWEALDRIGMVDPDYGWTVEMQIKAAQSSLRIVEVDVSNHPRIAGRSKVSGNARGIYLAGKKIIGTILRYR